MKSPKNHPRVFLVPRSCSSCSCSPPGRSQLVVRVATHSAAPSLWRPCAQSRRTVVEPRHPCADADPRRAMVPSLLQETETTGSQCRSSVTSRWELYRYTISKGPSAIILHFDFWFVQLYISWYFGKHGGLYFRSLGPLQIWAAVHVWSKHPKKEQHGKTVKWSPHFLETWFQLVLP